MFERRFADKLTYFDWKLGFMIDEDEVGLLLAKTPNDKMSITQESHAKKKG